MYRPRGAAVDVRELLARLADDRRVHDRHHLVDVVVDQAEEQRLVPILQARQMDVPLEVGLLGREVLVDARQLLVHGADRRRHKARRGRAASRSAGGERGALVGERIAEQRLAAVIDREYSSPVMSSRAIDQSMFRFILAVELNRPVRYEP